VESSILKRLMNRSCWITTSVHELLLALTFFMVKVTEPAVIAILTSALPVEAAAAAQPCEMPQ